MPRRSASVLFLAALLGGCDSIEDTAVPEGIPFGDYFACVQTPDGPVSIFLHTLQAGGAVTGEGWVTGNALVVRHTADVRADDPQSRYAIAEGSRDRSDVRLPFVGDGPSGASAPEIGGTMVFEGSTSLTSRIPETIEGTLSASVWGTHPAAFSRSGSRACAPR